MLLKSTMRHFALKAGIEWNGDAAPLVTLCHFVTSDTIQRLIPMNTRRHCEPLPLAAVDKDVVGVAWSRDIAVCSNIAPVSSLAAARAFNEFTLSCYFPTGSTRTTGPLENAEAIGSGHNLIACSPCANRSA